MDDSELHARISELVAEERDLEEGHIGTRATPEQEQRLRDVQVALDQAWDLLRQRRARRLYRRRLHGWRRLSARGLPRRAHRRNSDQRNQQRRRSSASFQFRVHCHAPFAHSRIAAKS